MENEFLRARLRRTCQVLVNAAGADGPMDAEEAAARLVAKNAALQAEVERLRAAIQLALVQDQGCGGTLTFHEQLRSTQRVLAALDPAAENEVR